MSQSKIKPVWLILLLVLVLLSFAWTALSFGWMAHSCRQQKQYKADLLTTSTNLVRTDTSLKTAELENRKLKNQLRLAQYDSQLRQKHFRFYYADNGQRWFTPDNGKHWYRTEPNKPGEDEGVVILGPVDETSLKKENIPNFPPPAAPPDPKFEVVP